VRVAHVLAVVRNEPAEIFFVHRDLKLLEEPLEVPFEIWLGQAGGELEEPVRDRAWRVRIAGGRDEPVPALFGEIRLPIPVKSRSRISCVTSDASDQELRGGSI
jgi:hypothetical protein